MAGRQTLAQLFRATLRIEFHCTSIARTPGRGPYSGTGIADSASYWKSCVPLTSHKEATKMLEMLQILYFVAGIACSAECMSSSSVPFSLSQQRGYANSTASAEHVKAKLDFQRSMKGKGVA